VYHRASVVACDLLVAEAEPEDGHVQVVDLLVVVRVLPVGGQTGAAGYDDPLESVVGLRGILGLPDLGQDAMAADLGGDEVGVLPPEIDDCDAVVVRIQRNSAPSGVWVAM
jgi:hypothetical protein